MSHPEDCPVISRTKSIALNWPTLSLFCLVLAFAHLAPVSARADIGPAASSVPSAQLVGKGRMTYLGFKVFDAQLYAPNGAYKASGPFALKLTYLRNFKGKAITESTVKEIKRQGGASASKLASWEKQMLSIFPNVSPGQSITGVRTAKGNTVFYYGGRKIGAINDPAFTKRFFAIWLGNNTRNPGLRAKLVGAGA
ncbi:chalcone isomerase family protein [Roseibium sp. HPY-6]|uniref:chalcone isomerase family protein n=1 Tax=Roseibium sp. HPY-6 TaxID=3229852 RepID=UPI00338F78C7